MNQAVVEDATAPTVRHASINDLAIQAEERLFHWAQGRRPDALASLSDLGL